MSAGRISRSQLKKVKLVMPADQAQATPDHSPSKKKKKTVKPVVASQVQPGDPAGWIPSRWQEQVNNIRVMRCNADAPVDIMGCAECSDTNADKKVQRFQILLSLMLSSQTKDQVTSAAMQRLIQGGCTVDQIVQMSAEDIGKVIIPVGFWRRKADYIKKAATILHDKYDGDIPHSVEELCSLPGVGPKMAYLAMQCAWGENVGIGVDTHVHRISQRLGWVQKPNSDPEHTRKELEDWMPKELWSEVNKLVVGFGQQICLPVKPKCTQCLNQNICPYAKTNKKK